MADETFNAEIVFTIDQAAKAAAQVMNLLANVQDGFREAGAAADASAKKMNSAIKSVAPSFKPLVDGLKDANEEYRKLVQADIAAGGSGKGLLSGKTTEELQRLVDIQDGYNASVVDGAKKELAARKGSTGSIISQRYALYDLATTYTAVSAAVTALGVASVKAFSDQEYAFANFRRTLDPSSTVEQINTLGAAIRKMSTEIPVSFSELSNVASIGNQLGIAREDVVQFTDTVIKSSVAMGLSVDEVATAYGQLGNLLEIPASQFQNLGASMALVGVNSAATEQQIISVAREIGATAAQAGFTADQVVGLSGALASLRIAPERARGSLDTYFATLNRAVSNGGQDLRDFATVVGVTSDQLDKMVREGKALEVFQGFLRGLGDLDSVDATSALDRLNLSQLRVSNSLIRLSENQGLLNSTLADGKRGYMEATELDRQYGTMLDTTQSSMQIFANSVENLAAAFGSKLAPALGAILGALVPVLEAFTDFIESPIGGFLASVVAGAMALVAVMAAVKAATAFAQASLLALQFVTEQYAAKTVVATGAVRAFSTAILGQAIPSMIGLNGKMAAGVAWSRALSAAMKGIPLLAVAGTVFALAENLGYALDQGSRFERVIEGVSTNVSTVQDALNGLNETLSQEVRKTGIAGFFGEMEDAESALRRFNEAFDALKTKADEAGTSMQAAFKDSNPAFTNVVEEFEAIAELPGKVDRSGESLEEFAAKASNASVAIAELPAEFLQIDEAIGRLASGGDLEGANNLILAFSEFTGRSVAELSQLLPILRMVSGEFASFSQYTIAVEGIPAALSRMQTAANRSTRAVAGTARQVRTLTDYASDLGRVLDRTFEIRFGARGAMDDYISSWREIGKEIDEYQRKVQSLTARRDLETYFLSIAEAYGDTFQAGNLRSSIADLNAEIADASAKASTTLTGTSDAAIENRKRITGLLSEYQDYLQALAASGASQDKMRKAVSNSKRDFIEQARALGYSEEEIKQYVKQFDYMTTAINKVPRKITVVPDVDPAIQALNELAAKSASAGSRAGSSFNKAFTKEMMKFQEASKLWAQYQSMLASYAANQGNYNAQTQISKELKKLQDRLNKLTKGFAGGGYTGSGGKYQPAGVVHRGEFVMNSEATRNIGVGNLYSMMRAAQSGRGYASGGYVSPTPVPVQSGGGVVTINPQQMNQLVSAVAQRVGVIISSDPRTQADIAKMSNAGNQILGNQGRR